MAAQSSLECAESAIQPYRDHSKQLEGSKLQRNNSESSQMSQDFDFDDFDKDDDDDETSSPCLEQPGARPAATNSKRQKT